jgi:hypothetical protein
MAKNINLLLSEKEVFLIVETRHWETSRSSYPCFNVIGFTKNLEVVKRAITTGHAIYKIKDIASLEDIKELQSVQSMDIDTIQEFLYGESPE